MTVAQTWRGQQVTGPSLEYRPNVTGDEPGDCRPVTGTPYQGPSTMFGWCEPDEADPATQRLEPRPKGVAVTGDLPMHSKLVTGIERGYRNDISGSSYYGEMRPAEPVADDWARGAFPVAQARRLAGRDPAKKRTDDGAARFLRPWPHHRGLRHQRRQGDRQQRVPVPAPHRPDS